MAITSKTTKAVVKKAAAKPAVLAPATEVAASGALIEPAIAKGVDTSHPAVDANPRATSTAEMNQIDFNDPTLSPEEAVAKNLGAPAPKSEG